MAWREEIFDFEVDDGSKGKIVVLNIGEIDSDIEKLINDAIVSICFGDSIFTIAERPVSRHDILDVVLKQGIDALSHQRVAEIVKRSLVLRKVCGGQAVSHHHVHPALEHLIRHLPCRLCGIGVIPVRDDIALCIDVAEQSGAARCLFPDGIHSAPSHRRRAPARPFHRWNYCRRRKSLPPEAPA